MATKLTDLIVDEVSLVDLPANRHSVIAFYKRGARPTLTPETRERLLASRERMLKALGALPPGPLMPPPTKGLHTTPPALLPTPAPTVPTPAELVQTEVDMAVKQLMATPRGKGLSYEQACVVVMKENPALYDKYIAAQTESKPLQMAKMAVDQLAKSADDVGTAMLASQIMRETPGLSFEHAMELASYQTRYGV